MIDVKDNIGIGALMTFAGSNVSQVRWQSNTTPVGLEASGTSSSDIEVSASATAQVSALFQDNDHEHGASFSAVNGGLLDLALVNNIFGDPADNSFAMSEDGTRALAVLPLHETSVGQLESSSLAGFYGT